jgi:hypothetical protein
VLDVNAIEADVNNGGFHQFFFNSAGDRVVQDIAALRLIGANKAADMLISYWKQHERSDG